MARGKRIKTYKKIYMEPSGPFSSPLGVLVMTLGFVAAAVVGWSVYGPVRDFVMSIGEIPPASGDASSAVSEATSDGASSGQQSDIKLPNDTQAKPNERSIDAVKAAYMPAQYASDAGRVDAFISSLPVGAFNTVIVDLKDEEGHMYYKSSIAMATQSGAVAAQVMGPAALAGRIRDAGYTPAARIHAFSDRTVTRNNRDAAVKYMDTDWIWLDNSYELGGNPWLNPYSDIAQGYVMNIASELAKAGFKLIIIDSLHFPTGVGLDKAGYGTAEEQTSRSAQLRTFASKLSEAVEALGGHCVVHISADDVLNPHELVFGGNPAEIYDGLIAVGMMPGDIEPGTVLGDTILSDPLGDPARTISLLMGALPDDARGRTIAWLQGYEEEGDVAGTAFVAAQTRGLPEQSLGYVIYNPQGVYKK